MPYFCARCRFDASLQSRFANAEITSGFFSSFLGALESTAPPAAVSKCVMVCRFAVLASSSSLASSRRAAWSRFVPFDLLAGGEERRCEGFDEGPPREKEREFISVRATCGVVLNEWKEWRSGSFVDARVDVVC